MSGDTLCSGPLLHDLQFHMLFSLEFSEFGPGEK